MEVGIQAMMRTLILLSILGVGCMNKDKPQTPTPPAEASTAAAPVEKVLPENHRFEGVHWGGKGFDHEGVYTRFSIQAYAPKNLLEVWIDQEKGVTTARIEFDSPDKKLTAANCNKAERHITAPVKCDFELDKVRATFSGAKATLFFKTGDASPEESTSIPAEELKKVLK